MRRPAASDGGQNIENCEAGKGSSDTKVPMIRYIGKKILILCVCAFDVGEWLEVCLMQPDAGCDGVERPSTGTCMHNII